MAQTFILLGSNLGDRKLNLDYALDLIGRLIGTVQKQSAVYETAPWGVEDQPTFYNRVLEVETLMNPDQLINDLQYIEDKLGRERGGTHWGARIIDIDVLYFEDRIIRTQKLTVPHPEMHKRRFTLLPLIEIAPDFIHPVLMKSSQELLETCPDELEVQKLDM